MGRRAITPGVSHCLGKAWLAGGVRLRNGWSIGGCQKEPVLFAEQPISPRGSDYGRMFAHLVDKYRHTNCRWVRGVPADRRPVDAPAFVYDLRTRWLLRQLSKQTRQQACRQRWPPYSEVIRARRGMGLVLCRPSLSRGRRLDG